MSRRRSRRRTAATSLGSVVVIMLCLGLAYLFQQAGRPESTTPASPTPVPLAEVEQGRAWYRVYFNAPTGSPDTEGTTGIEPRPNGGLDEAIAADITSAQRTVDMAIYEFGLQSIADALIAAHGRGVTVRLVSDSDSLEDDGIVRVRNAGIPVVFDERSPIMHDKFVVIDGATVWTGSMNFTPTDVYRNDNNMLRLVSPLLAANYTAEFEEMFVGRQFGPSSPADTPHPQIALDGTIIQNYFGSEDNVAARLVEQIRAAQTGVDFMAFTFTSDPIAEAILDRARAGLPVRGVFEEQQVAGCCPDIYDLMLGAQLDVRLDGNPYKLHHKVILLDGQTVITGSFNFTASADNANDENVLIIHNAGIAAQYQAEFERVWGKTSKR